MAEVTHLVAYVLYLVSWLMCVISEHEGSRRMKTELLVQMDGLAKSDDLVFLLAASNLPWSVVSSLQPLLLPSLNPSALIKYKQML